MTIAQRLVARISTMLPPLPPSTGKQLVVFSRRFAGATTVALARSSKPGDPTWRNEASAPSEVNHLFADGGGSDVDHLREIDLSAFEPVTSVANVRPADAALKLRSLYDPTSYAFAMFDAADIVYWLVLSGAIDRVDPSSTARWFDNSHRALVDQRHMESVMGHQRYQLASASLTNALATFDGEGGQGLSPVLRDGAAGWAPTRGTVRDTIGSPVVRCIWDVWCRDQPAHTNPMALRRLFGHAVAAWVPLLRALPAAVLVAEWARIVPAFTSGFVAQPLTLLECPALPGDDRARVKAMVGLLLAVAEEFGSRTVMMHACDTMRAHNLRSDYKTMCQVARVTSKIERRWHDWSVRDSAALALKLIPAWMAGDFKRIFHARMDAESKRVAEMEPRRHDDPHGPPGEGDAARSHGVEEEEERHHNDDDDPHPCQEGAITTHPARVSGGEESRTQADGDEPRLPRLDRLTLLDAYKAKRLLNDGRELDKLLLSMNVGLNMRGATRRSHPARRIALKQRRRPTAAAQHHEVPPPPALDGDLDGSITTTPLSQVATASSTAPMTN